MKKNFIKNKKNILDTSSLNSWIIYLNKIHYKNVDMSLERINTVAVRLNILKPAQLVFIVTGTNGKGTTCHMLESILIEANYKVGVYSSPHLICHTERIRIQNNILPENFHTDSFSKIENARGNISLTYFEYSTLSMLLIFKQAQIDIAIIEVGMGGRLDATNIIDADVAVITNIALDHTDILGIDRESIGREKAGIFRIGKPAIIGDLIIPKTVIKIAEEKKVKLLRYGIEWNFIVKNNKWDYIDLHGKISDLPIPNIPQTNAAIALAALRSINIKMSKQAILNGIKKAILPGRFQVINESPRIILDVAHNPHAAKYLAERLKLTIKTGKILAVVGMLKDKNISGTLIFMNNIVDSWYCASLEGLRGAGSAQIAKYLHKKKVNSYKNIVHAWNAALDNANPEDTILVFGSFQIVAYILKIKNLQN